MPLYMFQGAYTSESWAHQVRNQPDPVERVRPLIEACGGTLHSFYYAFGEYDVVLIIEMPDDESAAAVSLAASAGGSLSAGRTIKLLTVEQGLAAMRSANAASRSYTPPVSTVPRQAAAEEAPAGTG